MISIDQRINLVFLGVAFVLLQTIHNLIKYQSLRLRTAKFLQLLVLLFPILDFKLPPAELNFKLFDAAILTFVLLNIRPLLTIFRSYIHRNAYVFFGILLALALISEFILQTLLFDFRLVLVGLLLLLIRFVVEEGFDIYNKILFPVFLWAVVFFGLQLIYGVDFTLYQSSNETSIRDLRYTSFAQDPQKLAQIMFMLAIVFLGRIFQDQKFSSLKYWLIISACLAIGLATGARAGLLGFALAFVFLYLNKISVKSILLLGVMSLAGVLVFEWIYSFQTFQRMNELNDALTGRMELFWLKGWMIFNENLWFGVGPGAFPDYVTLYHSDFTYGINGPIVDQPESGYLLWLCELGIIGTVCYVSLMVYVLTRKVGQNNAKPFKLAIVVWLVGFITVYSLSDVKVLFLVTLCIAMVLHQPKLESK